mmetsp:Transcript_44678/g.83804  ORF Transcript_44678/g.83804 Transcript_44678/m.83804 type:complete len:542 (-) Transcript_44678:228-1853(-)
MPIITNKFAVVFACLSYAGQGRHIQTSSEANVSSNFAEERRFQMSPDGTGNPHSLADGRHSRSSWHAGAKDSMYPLTAFTKLLLAFIPAAAFRPSGLGARFSSGVASISRAHTALAAEDQELAHNGAPTGLAFDKVRKIAKAENRKVRSPARAIKGFYAAFNQRELERVGSFLTDDCVYEDLLFGPATICRGKKAFMNALQFHPAFVSSNIFSQLPFAEVLPSLTLEVDSIAEGADSVGVEWHVQCGPFAFPLGRGLSHAQFCPRTGKIKRVVDIAEAPWRVVGLLSLPFINFFRFFSKAFSQERKTLPLDLMASMQPAEMPSKMRNEANYEAALLKGTEELTGDIIVQLEILEAAIGALGPDHPAALWGKNNLASTLQARGDLEEAEELQREVLEARISAFGVEHPDTLWTKHNLANTLRARGDLQAAQALQREVLAVRTRILGPEHPSTIAIKDNLDLTVEEFRAAKKEYTNADVDGSGELDVQEFRAFALKLGIADHSEADQIFKDVDTDGSGTIDLKEFTSWYSTSPWCQKAQASTV